MISEHNPTLQTYSGRRRAPLQLDAHGRLKTVSSPLAFGPGGDYKLPATTGAMATGSNLWFFVFRWTHATLLCAIHRVTIQGLAAVTAFTAGVGSLEMKRATASSDSGSGGTSLALTGSAGKKRLSMPATGLAAVRIATTAGLGVPTASFDGNGMGAMTFGVPAVAGQTLLPPNCPIFDASDRRSPLVLAQNDLIAIRATLPATGTWQASVDVDWTETDRVD